MDPQLSPAQTTHSSDDPSLPGAHSQPRRQPAGRKPLKGIDEPLSAQALVRTVRAGCPRLNRWLNQVLPDPRNQEMCLYTAAHLWWQVIGTFLSRKGSRNGFDQQRHSGQAAWNMGALCGQSPEDPRFGATPAAWTLKRSPKSRC
jgi:hypothetical protein